MAEVAVKIPKLVCRGMQGNQLTFTRRRHMAHCALWASLLDLLDTTWSTFCPLHSWPNIWSKSTACSNLQEGEFSLLPKIQLPLDTNSTHFYRNLKIPHEEIKGTVENCKSVIISFTSMPSDPLKEPNLGRLMVVRGADSNQVKRFLKAFSSGQKCLSD